MPIAVGTRLGPFEIVAPLGAGGMGEVYRARDTALGREVAIKLLPRTLEADPDSQLRFEREARALAALNHVNIATLYGVERVGEARALVMELVEGETLADRLVRGPLPLVDALRIARQIADGVEAAHAKAIVHRDLKPANIKITASGTVKVLDFGLAKAAAGLDSLTAVTRADVTREGVVMGTAGYMSPQQARGQIVETDADIWAFGCILFEMLVGQRAFAGETASDIIANVLQREPDWAALPDSTPVDVVRMMRRCLQKDPARRLRNIADARLEIEDQLASPADSTTTIPPARTPDSSKGPARWATLLAIGALAVGVAAGMLVQSTRRSGAPVASVPHASVFGLLEPPGEPLYVFAEPVSVSPDGRQIALITNGPQGQPRLWLRSLGELEPKRVEGADGAMCPFWSPDGRSLGFLAHDELRVLDLASRSLRTLASFPAMFCGGTWNREGTIVYADGTTGLKRVPAAGGTSSPVPSPGPSGDPVLVTNPQFLPDGRHFLYFAAATPPARSAMMLGDLDSPTRKSILSVETKALYAPPGFLVYVRDGDIVGHRFDLSSYTAVGDPVVVGRRAWVSLGLSAVAASETGVLAFVTQRLPVTQLTWFDRAGKPLGPLGEPGLWIHAAVSPDGKTVAAERVDERTGAGAAWTMDASRGAASRLSLRSGWTLSPVWSPQGDRVALSAFGSTTGEATVITMPVDGSATEQIVPSPGGQSTPTDWLPGQRGLVISTAFSSGGDVGTIAFDGGGTMTPLVATPFAESYGKVSPDGRWLAYVSNESGRPEIYVRPLGGGAGRWRVSQGGGSQPRWRRDGRELFFVSETNRIMAAAIAPDQAFDAGAPVELPIETERDLTGGRYVYDVGDLGRRFLVIRRSSQDLPSPITVIVNWPSLVR